MGNSIKYINRDFDVITGDKSLETLYSFDRFPVFMGCTNQSEDLDEFALMQWTISKTTGLIQLNPLLPLDVVYQIGHGSGSTGSLWDQHHGAFANFIRKFNPQNVLEIGGCHGILATKYHALDPINWTIVEPNPMPVGNVPAKFIKGFFDDKFESGEDFDAFVHSHVFEHIYEPDVFMSHLSMFMEEGKFLIFSIPNMQVMLERKYTNCLNFEHTILLTEPYIDHLLSKHGFRIFSREYFKDDHSIFYCAVRDSIVKEIEIPQHLVNKNRELYSNYITYHESLIDEMNRSILSAQYPIFLFGAHIFTQYLLSFGLNAKKITAILDNDKLKQGKRLYGSNLKVQAPQILKNYEKAIVILRAGVYNDEIKNDILENINSNIDFWV